MKDSFYHHYRYVEKISVFVEKEPGYLYDGTRYVFLYLLSEMQNTVAGEALHPALQTLRAYDGRHHTAFYEPCGYICGMNAISPIPPEN